MKVKTRLPYGEKHEVNLKAVIALNRATNHLNRRASAVFRRHGLTMMQFAVLEVLYHRGDLTVGEIIQKILTTGGNMTVVLKNLVKEGLITRCVAPTDNRVAIVSLSERGAAKIEQLFPEYLEDLADFLKCLPTEEKKALTATLKTMQRSDRNGDSSD
jgi:MarR family 2-MHQ and catechol resistance regulon transcriptional repressor